MSYFRQHVFFCVNQRQAGGNCCNNHHAEEIRSYAKKRIKELGLNGKANIRINAAGCMDRCDEGPVLVIYPEGVWYTYVDKTDIDEIVSEHIQNGRVVERLKI
ncbi:MAG: (2Fe-2S) ferredoxin domain-containing protein [Rhodocyclaceae bacterium]|nr:(2Fe-2S) ferredoxin domain-containing protein [Rhodocyclaceae bacterium]